MRTTQRYQLVPACGRGAFTLVELLVVMSIIAVMVSLIFPTFGVIKERGRIVVCESNLQQLFHAFMAYAQDNKGCMPRNGGGGAANYDGRFGRYWVNGFHTTGTNCIQGVLTGSVYPYINDIKTYRCPSMPDSAKDRYIRSYEMSDCLGFPPTSTISYDGILNEDTKDALHRRAETFAAVPRPSQTLLLVECTSLGDDGYYSRCNDRNFPALYHLGKSPVLFVDGHVELLSRLHADEAYEGFYHQLDAERKRKP